MSGAKKPTKKPTMSEKLKMADQVIAAQRSRIMQLESELHRILLPLTDLQLAKSLWSSGGWDPHAAIQRAQEFRLVADEYIRTETAKRENESRENEARDKQAQVDQD